MSTQSEPIVSSKAKAIVALIISLLGAISAWGITAAVDGEFDSVEWFGLIGALATAIATTFGVYIVPNRVVRGTSQQATTAPPGMSHIPPGPPV